MFLCPVSANLSRLFYPQPFTSLGITKDQYSSRIPLVAAFLALTSSGCSLDTIGLFPLRRAVRDGGSDTSDIMDVGEDVLVDDIPLDQIPDNPPEDQVIEDIPLDNSTEDVSPDAMDVLGEMDSGFPEVVTDAGEEIVADTGVDVPMDAGIDVRMEDTGVDVGIDAGRETGIDTGTDTGMDAGMDVRMDTGVDVAPVHYPPPIFIRPSVGIRLLPTAAYILLQHTSPIPGNSFAGYQICSAFTLVGGSTMPIPDLGACESNELVLGDVSTLSLVVGAQYAIQARACYRESGGSSLNCSEFNEIRRFSSQEAIGHWTLGSVMGSTVSDISGHIPSHPGTLRNSPSLVPGINGSALRLMSSRFQSVEINDSDGLFNFPRRDFYMAVWIRPEFTGRTTAIVEKRAPSDGYEFYISGGNRLVFYTSLCGERIQSIRPLEAGVWQYVAASRSGDRIDLYVNAENVGGATCESVFTNDASLSLGCNSPGIGCIEAFNGDLYNMIISNVFQGVEVNRNDYCATLFNSGLALSVLPTNCQ